jgi:hypothetical protein
MRCIACGCTDDRACPGGCSWISHNPPKCSACFDQDGDPLEVAGEDNVFYGAERCPASPTGAPHTPIWITEVTGYCARCRCGFQT